MWYRQRVLAPAHFKADKILVPPAIALKSYLIKSREKA